MLKTINVEIESFPNTCFDCCFSVKKYYWAVCPFLNTTKEDGQPIPKECPLKEKNSKKTYKFSLTKSK